MPAHLQIASPEFAGPEKRSGTPGLPMVTLGPKPLLRPTAPRQRDVAHFRRAELRHRDGNEKIRRSSARWSEAKARCNSHERRHTLSEGNNDSPTAAGVSTGGPLKQFTHRRISDRLKEQSDDLLIDVDRSDGSIISKILALDSSISTICRKTRQTIPALTTSAAGFALM